MSILGAHLGQASAVRSNRSGNNDHQRVRSEGQLTRKSSKRVHDGEPILVNDLRSFFPLHALPESQRRGVCQRRLLFVSILYLPVLFAWTILFRI